MSRNIQRYMILSMLAVLQMVNFATVHGQDSTVPPNVSGKPIGFPKSEVVPVPAYRPREGTLNIQDGTRRVTARYQEYVEKGQTRGVVVWSDRGYSVLTFVTDNRARAVRFVAGKPVAFEWFQFEKTVSQERSSITSGNYQVAFILKNDKWVRQAPLRIPFRIFGTRS